MKRFIVAILVISVFATVASGAFATIYSFERGETISETAWAKFVTNKPATVWDDWACKVDASDGPICGQVFMASDNYTWGSSLYTYPAGGNKTWGQRTYRSNVKEGNRVNWRMRTNNITTGAVTNIRGAWDS